MSIGMNFYEYDIMYKGRGRCGKAKISNFESCLGSQISEVNEFPN
jgi:hypothetical protein